MRKAFHKSESFASGPQVAGWTHISTAISEFLAELTAEALDEAEQHGPIRGRVVPAQRPWSRVLDQIEAERQAST